MSRPLFSSFDLVLAQNERSRSASPQLGAAEARGVGNLKADAPPPPVDKAGTEMLAAALAGRPVWLAASTHPGEDDMVAVGSYRHEARASPISSPSSCRGIRTAARSSRSSLARSDLKVALRSEGKLPDAATDIYIADTIGEIGLFYTLAPVAFVGGSLVPHGGQNPIEAIKLGAAVLTGPNFQNFARLPMRSC